MRRHAEHKWFPEQEELWCAGEQGRKGGQLPQAPPDTAHTELRGSEDTHTPCTPVLVAQQGATMKDGWEAMRLPCPESHRLHLSCVLGAYSL